MGRLAEGIISFLHKPLDTYTKTHQVFAVSPIQTHHKNVKFNIINNNNNNKINNDHNYSNIKNTS